AGQLVRLGLDLAADLEAGVVERDNVADLQIQPRKQGRIGRRAEDAITLGEQVSRREGRLEIQLTEQRIGLVTAVSSTSANGPLAARTIARVIAATETWPLARSRAISSGFASRWNSEKATSPPSRVRPSRVSPSLRLAATEPTPAIAITPSAMQAMKT